MWTTTTDYKHVHLFVSLAIQSIEKFYFRSFKIFCCPTVLFTGSLIVDITFSGTTFTNNPVSAFESSS